MCQLPVVVSAGAIEIDIDTNITWTQYVPPRTAGPIHTCWLGHVRSLSPCRLCHPHNPLHGYNTQCITLLKQADSWTPHIMFLYLAERQDRIGRDTYQILRWWAWSQLQSGTVPCTIYLR